MILRGCLFGALGVVVGLGFIGDAADIGARHFATKKVEERISQVVPQATGVHGHIRSFPFLEVGVNGRVSDIGARIDRIPAAPVVFTNVVVDLHGARVSIGNIVTSLRLDVQHIQSGDVSFTLATSYLQRAVPTVAAADLRVSVDAAHRRLVLRTPSGATVTLPLPSTSLVPCTPGVAPGPAGLTFGCSFTAVPAAFTSVTTVTTAAG